MGTALTGLEIKDTYDSLIKVTDNGPLTGSLKVLTDGLGNDSTLSLSTTAASIAGTLAVSGDFSIADKIVHIGDTNTAIRFPAADTITFETSGVEATRITSAGDVGIGTITPVGILHLKKTAAATRLAIDGDAAQNKLISYRTAGVQRFGLYVNNTAESGTNAGSNFAVRAYADAGTLLTTPLFIQRSTGNVGIGNNLTPTSTLDVTGTLAVSGNATFDTDVLFVDAANNRVGIGTASPSFKLDVRNDVLATTSLAPTSISLYNNSDGGAAINMSNSVGGKGALAFSAESTGGGTDDVAIIFSNSLNASALTERMRITSAGNVGIGTNAPAVKLSVIGPSGGNAIYWSDLANNSGYLGIRGGSVASVGADNNLVFETASTERMRVDATGNVGIGTSSPAAGYRLSVVGAFTAALGGAYVEVGDFDRSLMVLNHTNVSVNANLLQVQKSGTGVFTINPAGIVQIASGIQFPATQVASADANTLDDYEEGTFTPTLAFGGTGISVYNTRKGFYTKIGNTVNFTIFIQVQQKGAGTGAVTVSLPLASVNTQDRSYSINVTGQSLSGLSGALFGYLVENSSSVQVFQTDATGGTALTDAVFNDFSTDNIIVTGTYQA
jgi:hypothetical protein